MKPVEINEVKEWKVEKILNKRKIRGVVKYLIQWKRFTAEYNSWEKKEDLENVKKVVIEFERRMNAEVRQQAKLDLAEERDFKKRDLFRKYTAKMLYG